MRYVPDAVIVAWSSEPRNPSFRRCQFPVCRVPLPITSNGSPYSLGVHDVEKETRAPDASRQFSVLAW